jgi:hypothetical protein
MLPVDGVAGAGAGVGMSGAPMPTVTEPLSPPPGAAAASTDASAMDARADWLMLARVAIAGVGPPGQPS